MVGVEQLQHTQETDEQAPAKDDSQGNNTANKSKQLDSPDITDVAKKHSITSTNAVYKAMGRTGPGRSHERRQ